ncbi:molecular chaperone HtpG [uncultured Adlercreutzia sp.]|uniref:molecular chaperone HtpG n=1 Tax=uncultured Adlercreutzia sp. TaxID=875803 RepID=UPI0026768C32|nr:molecular chaperone HtpG [uncultured Adlercreutzia sp.]
MKQFETESARLLDLVINSIYTNHEVFLRELVSNASDALDKAALARAEQGLPAEEGAITVAFDAATRTLTVSDDGIGMDAAALEECLGTIAHSDSRQVREGLADGSADLIGQFGVGFYSAFMVADEVTVTSRALGDARAYRWTSDGVSGYAIEPAERERAGTDVVLHIRESTPDENLERYLDQSSLVALIRKHSNYVAHPILMDLAEEHFDADTGALVRDEAKRTLTRVNAEAPLWTLPEEAVSDEALAAFYRDEFRDGEDPLLAVALHGRPPLPFDALLFVPAEAPEGLWDKSFERGLRLYSAGVLIEEACEALLPDHLRFVRGVVDTAQLNLTVSREAIREDGRVQLIGRQIERCLMDRLRTMAAEDRATYERFFAAFGTGIKFSIAASHGDMAAPLADLLLYYSAREERLVTLAEYARHAEEAGRTEVCYIVGTDRERLRSSAAVQAALRTGLDVLLCTEGARDELCLMLMGTYKGLPFHSVTSANFSVGDEDTATAREATDADRRLCERMLYHSPEPLSRIVPSPLLTGAHDAAARLTTEGTVTLAVARYALTRAKGGPRPALPLVLEVNTAHPLFARARAADQSDNGGALGDVTQVLLGQAMLAEDLPLASPAAFNEAVNRLIGDRHAGQLDSADR